jgi:hypothetical protein
MSIQITVANNIRAMRKKSARRKSIWMKPKEGFVMVNVDASFNRERLSRSVGAVTRDEAGNSVAACNDPVHDYAIDASTLEAQAISWEIALANEIGCPKITLQSDCSQVIDTLQSSGFQSTAVRPLYDYIYVQASNVLIDDSPIFMSKLVSSVFVSK